MVSMSGPHPDASCARLPKTSSVDHRIADAFDLSHPPMSAQAGRLHACCIEAALDAGTEGLIGRAAAAELAEECGALMEELVETGYWRETDVSYELAVSAS